MLIKLILYKLLFLNILKIILKKFKKKKKKVGSPIQDCS